MQLKFLVSTSLCCGYFVSHPLRGASVVRFNFESQPAEHIVLYNGMRMTWSTRLKVPAKKQHALSFMQANFWTVNWRGRVHFVAHNHPTLNNLDSRHKLTAIVTQHVKKFVRSMRSDG